jgi:hypothetical protein
MLRMYGRPAKPRNMDGNMTNVMDSNWKTLMERVETAKGILGLE